MHDLFEISTQKTSDEKRPTHVCALRTHCRNDILIRRTAHDRERSTARHSVTVPDMSAEVSALAKAGHCVLYPARARAHAAHSYAVRKGSAQVLSLCVTSLIQLHQPYVHRLLKSAHVLYSPIPRQRICPRSTACIRSRASLPRGVTTRILHRSIIAQPQVFPHRMLAGADVSPPCPTASRGRHSAFRSAPGHKKTAAALLRGSPMGYREQIRSGPVHPPEIFDLGYWRAFSPLLRFSTDFVVAAPSVLNLDETPPSLSPTILRNCWCTELICLV